jgi:hypothetical protein
VRNSIFWGNEPNEIDWAASDSNYTEVKYSDIQGGYSGPGSDNIDAHPQFIAPFFFLSPTSPCIDAASNSYGPDDDIGGVPRPLDGDGDGTATCDMGAYEFIIADFNRDSNVNFRDYTVFASAWNSEPGDNNWKPGCDMAKPRNLHIGVEDLDIFIEIWLIGN